MTEKEVENTKEEEIDELLEFAYELDYEKYMEDFEVRQALAIIKERVNEIKKDDDWKQNIVKEWNEAGNEDTYNKQQKDDDQKSVVSYSKQSTLINDFRKHASMF